MELSMRRVLLGFLGLFLALEVWVGYWVVWRGPELSGHARNPRRIAAELKIARGSILDRDGEVLATSIREKNTYYRQFTGPVSLAQTIGYSHLRFGKSGLERAFDADLRGDTVRPKNLLASLVAKKEGLDIVTTIDSQVQLAAEKALAGRRGAVVALDAKSGAIMAVASAPTFDPNTMDETLFAKSSNGALFNRAIQGRYPPGSAFKPVILAAALKSGRVRESQTFTDNGSYNVDGFEIHNYENEIHGRLNMKSALAYSSNVAFVQIGLQAGGRAIYDLAKSMGVLDPPTLGIPASTSHLPSGNNLNSRRAVAQMSIGQGEAWVSPLSMAMVAATIANGGYTIRPYLVQSIGGDEVAPAQPHVRVIPEKVNDYVTDAMRDTVRRGTGSRAAVRGTTVYGKTGTADNPGGKPHAWFIGFAPYKNGMVAVAAVVENVGTGGVYAAPIVANVIEAVVEKYKSGTPSAKSR